MRLPRLIAGRAPKVEIPSHGPAAQVMIDVPITVLACDTDEATIRVRIGPKDHDVTLAPGECLTVRLVGYDFAAVPDA